MRSPLSGTVDPYGSSHSTISSRTNARPVGHRISPTWPSSNAPRRNSAGSTEANGSKSTLTEEASAVVHSCASPVARRVAASYTAWAHHGARTQRPPARGSTPNDELLQEDA